MSVMKCGESLSTQKWRKQSSGVVDFWSKMAVCALGAASVFGELSSGLEILMNLA